jgi:SEC-C motif-containing protein
MGKVEYISTTHDPDKRDDVDLKAAEQWAEHAEWQGLDIIDTEAGGADDDEGVVEFAARFGMQGKDQRHHERSRFKKIEGKWYYMDGDMVKNKPVVREGAKVGRNEPCPCGSGKKYKRCCG